MQKNSNEHFNNLSHKIFTPSDVCHPYQDQLCQRLCTSFIGMGSKGHSGFKKIVPISLWKISDLVIFDSSGENVVFAGFGEFEHIALSFTNQAQHLSNKELRLFRIPFYPDPLRPGGIGGGIGDLGAHKLLFVSIAPP